MNVFKPLKVGSRVRADTKLRAILYIYNVPSVCLDVKKIPYNWLTLTKTGNSWLQFLHEKDFLASYVTCN